MFATRIALRYSLRVRQAHFFSHLEHNMEAQPNAYSPPEGELITAATGYNTPKFFALNGRIGRLRYLAYSSGIGLLSWLVIAALMVPMMMSFAGGSTMMSLGMGALIFLAYIPILVFSFAYAVRRLNDLDQSGWLSLLLLVPLVNLGLALYLMIGRGTDGANKYGLPPPPNNAGVIIVGCVLPLVVTIGILAAVAIPAYQSYVEHAAPQQGNYSVDPDSGATDANVEQSEPDDTATDSNASSESTTTEESATEETATDQSVTEESTTEESGVDDSATESEPAAEQ